MLNVFSWPKTAIEVFSLSKYNDDVDPVKHCMPLEVDGTRQRSLIRKV